MTVPPSERVVTSDHDHDHAFAAQEISVGIQLSRSPAYDLWECPVNRCRHSVRLIPKWLANESSRDQMLLLICKAATSVTP